MKQVFSVLLAFGFAQAASADVFVGIEQEVAPTALRAIADGIDDAAARQGEQQNYSLYLEIQDHMMLVCPAHKPDAAGNGCGVFFTPATPGQRGDIGMSIRKDVSKSLLTTKADEAAAKISSIDPNSTENHEQFGNPLYTLTDGQTDGTHYYCAPEGETGKRTWKCYLSVSERLSQQASK